MHRNAAMALILLGGTCMSFVGLLMRLIDSADGFQILAYRSVSLAVIVMLVACLKRRVWPITFFRQLDLNDLAMGATLAIAFMTYVFAMLWTSVASTLFILTAAPFLAALIGWVWIGERPRPVVWIAMIGATFGVGLMIEDGISLGRNAGNLMALLSAVMFAVMLVLARRSRKTDVLGGTFLGGVFAGILGILCAAVLSNSLVLGAYDMGLILFMGAFTIGIGIAFVTWGAPFLPAAEVSLLVLIESVLGPIWVWVFLGEAMSGVELFGGTIVLVSVCLMSLVGKKKRLRSV